MNTKKFWMAFSFFVITTFTQTSFAQGLNWEGQTGALLTPFAYTAASPARKFGRPEVAFHYLNSGNVIGNDYQLSITEGLGNRFEFGYTGAFSSAGGSPVSSLFSNGFGEFHGKLKFVDENAKKTKWIPAIAVGAIGRTGIERIGSVLNNRSGAASNSTTNGDFYIVATKAITQWKVPILLSLGDKLTNASVFGVAGNAAYWQGRVFGAAGFVIKGPARSALVFGAEAAQQPHYVQGLGSGAGAPTIPTSLSYFARVVPHLERSPLQIDIGVAQLVGKISPGLPNLDARAQVGMGISYHF
jgi:hypothetical protein